MPRPRDHADLPRHAWLVTQFLLFMTIYGDTQVNLPNYFFLATVLNSLNSAVQTKPDTALNRKTIQKAGI